MMDLFYFFIKLFVFSFICFLSAWLTYIFLGFLGLKNKGVQSLIMQVLVAFVAVCSAHIMQGVIWGVGLYE